MPQQGSSGSRHPRGCGSVGDACHHSRRGVTLTDPENFERPLVLLALKPGLMMGTPNRRVAAFGLRSPWYDNPRGGPVTRSGQVGEQLRPDMKKPRVRWRERHRRFDPKRPVFIDETRIGIDGRGSRHGSIGSRFRCLPPTSARDMLVMWPCFNPGSTCSSFGESAGQSRHSD